MLTSKTKRTKITEKTPLLTKCYLYNISRFLSLSNRQSVNYVVGRMKNRNTCVYSVDNYARGRKNGDIAREHSRSDMFSSRAASNKNSDIIFVPYFFLEKCFDCYRLVPPYQIQNDFHPVSLLVLEELTSNSLCIN